MKTDFLCSRCIFWDIVMKNRFEILSSFLYEFLVEITEDITFGIDYILLN